MNKQDLIEKVSAETGFSKEQTKTTLEAILEAIKTGTKEDKKVTLPGFGNFEARERSARNGVNPSTGETIQIAAKTVPAFKAGKAFKDIF